MSRCGSTFLLSLPFLSSFRSVTGAQRVVYYATFLATMIAMVLLIVPPAYHRQAFRQRQKVQIVESGTRLLLSALAMLGIAVVGVVYLVSDVLFHWQIALGVAGCTAALLVGLWYWYPRRQTRGAARVDDEVADASGEAAAPGGAGGSAEPPRRAA